MTRDESQEDPSVADPGPAPEVDLADLEALDGAEIDRLIEEGLAEGPDASHEGQVKVLECPDCGESDLAYVAGLVTGRKYQCPHCGYEGALAVERWRSPEELREQAGRGPPDWWALD